MFNVVVVPFTVKLPLTVKLPVTSAPVLVSVNLVEPALCN